MVRKGIDLVALFYLATALVCFVPYFQYGHSLLILAGLIYGIPFFVGGGGLALRREWSRKFAMIASSLLVWVVLPLLFRKQLVFHFSYPLSVSITYPPSSVFSFKGLFGGLILGHIATVVYFARGSVREAFQRRATEKEGR